LLQYFAIQASLELKAGILDKLGVDSAEKRYKQLVSTHLSVPFRLFKRNSLTLPVICAQA